MSTSFDTTHSTPIPGVAASALLGLMAFTLAAGCGGLPPAEAMSLEQATRAIEPGECPTGTCTDPNNGKGLFISEGSSYCIPLAPNGQSYFCPEYFTNLPTGGVKLTGQSIDELAGFSNPPRDVMYPVTGFLNGKPVGVISISLEPHELVVTVLDSLHNPRQVTGSELTDLALAFTDLGAQFTLRFRPANPENGVGLYHAEYSFDAGSSWQTYCKDGTGTAAFLPERTVHSVTGQLYDSANTLTVACRTGAIATCMVWDYKPWKNDPEDPVHANVLYGSCLQAKRAAYFVKSGDFNSYTVPGTPLALQDKYGFMSALMPGAEALWGPDGAVCFSPQFRRIPPAGSQPLPALPSVIPVPECALELHQAASAGALSGLLQAAAPLVTGPVP